MKIIKITSIDGCRTFHDFTWQSTLPEFQDYNLIYGWNGTGKTTISDILRAIEHKQTDFQGKFTVLTESGQLKSADLEGVWGSKIPPIRVFNRDYVRDNIFGPDGDPITPIFYLGEENVEKQKQVEIKTKQLETETENHTAKTREKSDRAKEIEELCTKGARAVKDALLSNGENPYNNYDKRDFRKKIDAISQSGADLTSYAQTDEQKATLKARFTGVLKDKLTPPDIHLPDLNALREKVGTVLERSIVSQTLEILQNNAELSGWVKQGLDIHKHGELTDCQFCLQPLLEKRVKALEGHFNDEYSNMMADLAEAATSVQRAMQMLDAITYPDKAAICDHLVSKYADAVSALQADMEKYHAFLTVLQQSIALKQAKPFEKIANSEVTDNNAAQSYKSYIDVLNEHNADCANHATAVKEARQKFEAAIVSNYVDAYKTLKQSIANADEAEKTIFATISTLNQDIKTLEMEIKEHRKPAEQINNDLISYLGHNELRFETKDNGYVIYRFDQPASDLSEGEKTAIALLYFLKTLEDKNFKLSEGVVVIDDPVSSMDDGALFHAFGYIKAKTKAAKQLIILTHNFMFFRQVRNWFHHVKKPKRTSFYQTHCAMKLGKRCSDITMVDPLLREYESEYHYLFSLVHKIALASSDTILGEYYAMPNVARRVLESFLAFRNPSIKGKDRLWAMLEATDYDQTQKTKILRFVHAHSHEDHIGTPQHDPSLLTETPQIMKSLLKLIEAVDPGHYNEMLKVIAPPVAAAVAAPVAVSA